MIPGVIVTPPVVTPPPCGAAAHRRGKALSEKLSAKARFEYVIIVRARTLHGYVGSSDLFSLLKHTRAPKSAHFIGDRNPCSRLPSSS